jgi:hypothetical protein
MLYTLLNENPSKVQKRVRKNEEVYEALLGWIRFANGEQNSAPGVGLAFTRPVRVFGEHPNQDRVELKLPNYATSLRKDADNILRQLAEQVRALPAGREWMVKHPPIDLPARPRRLLIVGNHVEGVHATVQEGQAPLDGLIEALAGGIDRLRICDCDDCDKLFLALNQRRHYCSPACRQKAFYNDNSDDEKKRKLHDYYKNKARNQQMRHARKQREVWIRPKSAPIH